MVIHPFLCRPSFSASSCRRRHNLARHRRSSDSDLSSRHRRSSDNDRTNPPILPSNRDRAQRAKRKRHVRDDDDRISQLPDDILVDIISFLPLKEAGRTSVLSSRWVNLWKYTPYLNFDGDRALGKIRGEKKHKLLSVEEPKYMKWVNHVLGSHKAPILKEFRICFPLDMRFENAITQWLELAFARQVERLELDLQKDTYPSRFYCFPDEFLAQSTRMHFQSLKELSFKKVRVTDRAVEFFLNNCPLLEILVIHESDKLSKLEICGSSLRLKHLEIVRCIGLKSLKVSAPSLTSLRTMVADGVLLLENVPMLVHVFVYCRDDEKSLRHLFSTLSCCISQLEILHLMLVRRLGEARNELRKFARNELCKFPELPNLKKFVVQYLF